MQNLIQANVQVEGIDRDPTGPGITVRLRCLHPSSLIRCDARGVPDTSESMAGTMLVLHRPCGHLPMGMQLGRVVEFSASFEGDAGSPIGVLGSS
jgi:hypothetical protein